MISEIGRSVSLLDVLHACGDDAAITKCTCETEPMPCAFMRTCKAHKFYTALAEGLAEAYSRITIEDIANGVCGVEIHHIDRSVAQENVATP